MNGVEDIMRKAPVIPVLVIDDVAHAVPVAKALVAGGLPVLEVTLRTAAAIDVIKEMKQVPGAIVGAGTVLNPADLDASLAAGAEFIVSPGLTESLGKAAISAGVRLGKRWRMSTEIVPEEPAKRDGFATRPLTGPPWHRRRSRSDTPPPLRSGRSLESAPLPRTP